MNAIRTHRSGLEPKPTVLYIEDDNGNRQAFHAAFRRDFNVVLASNAAQAWAALESQEIHVVVADQRMPDLQGSHLLHDIRLRYPMVRRMLVTGYADIQAVIDAVNLGGVSHYIAKPWDPSEVLHAVHDSFEDYMKEKERNDQTERLQEANRQLEFALRQQLLS